MDNNRLDTPLDSGPDGPETSSFDIDSKLPEKKSGKGGLRPETQADPGWRRPGQGTSPQSGKGGLRPETQADPGWRRPNQGANPQSGKDGLRPETQADPGWRRPNQGTNPQSGKGGLRPETQADPGWRRPGQGTSPQSGKGGLCPETQADPGWKRPNQDTNPQSGKDGFRPETQADPGWRRPGQGTNPQSGQGSSSGSGKGVSLEAIMDQATGSRTATLQEFKESAARIPVLISYGGRKYPVKKALSRDGGESLVLLCSSPGGKDVAAKVYYKSVNNFGSSSAARAQVLRYMATPEGRKYTLAVSDIGLVDIGSDRHYFEIMPYCRDGDLENCGPTFSFGDMVDLTRHLNEALHSMHQVGILHRDLKPANLYRLDGRIVIGDFGVARQANAGMTSVNVGTDGYRAPETLIAVTATQNTFFYDERCDYYSLGITLGSIFQGHFVYKDMNPAMVTLHIHESKVPLTRQDKKRSLLENLLRGLCRYDPNYRFGYEDVCRWAADPNYTGGISGGSWPRGYHLRGTEHQNERSLFEGITADSASWSEAREMLYRKYFEQFFMSFQQDLAAAARNADDNWRTVDRDKGLAVFLKALYAPGPIVWKGYTFHSLKELAERMVVTKSPAAYGEFLQKKLVSHWLENTSGISVQPDTLRLVKAMEAVAQKEPELACYWFGNSFAGRKSVTVCGTTVSDYPQLLKALFQSSRSFYLSGGYEMLMDRSVGAGLYGFLYSLGCEKIIDQYWNKARSCEEYQKACLLFDMLDTIAVKVNADPAIIRRFFLSYGPVGIATYTRTLLSQKGAAVYMPMDAAGKALLEKIVAFRASNPGNVEKIYQDMVPLTELVSQLQKMLTDNPFCISTGTYEQKGVLCRNLQGCFCFRVFGKSAPLGFQAWLEGVKEGGQK